jgi:hypothetical protein
MQPTPTHNVEISTQRLAVGFTVFEAGCTLETFFVSASYQPFILPD